MIDPHSLDVLDYRLVRSRVAEACASPLGAALAGELSPMTDAASVARSIEATSELVRLLSADETPDLSHLEDISPILAVMSRPGDALTLPELVALRAFLRLARAAQARIRGLDPAAFPRMTGDFGSLRSPEGARDAAEGVLTEEGSIRDDASPGLLSVRDRLRSTRGSLTSVLEGIVGDPSLGQALSDRVVTQRDGRYVVPVKSSAADRVDGVIID